MGCYMLMHEGGDGGDSAVVNFEVVVNPGARAFRLFVFCLTVETSASIINVLLYYILVECLS